MAKTETLNVDIVEMIKTTATATAREIGTLTGATGETVTMGGKGNTDLETVSERGIGVMKRETDTTGTNVVMVEEPAVLKNDLLVVDEGTKKSLPSLLSLCMDTVTGGRGMMNLPSLRSP